VAGPIVYHAFSELNLLIPTTQGAALGWLSRPCGAQIKADDIMPVIMK
jgi:hypothetical protein